MSIKQVYKVDELGYLKDIYIKDFNSVGNCTEELEEDVIVSDPPQGLYKAKWNGEKWVEDMTQEEITELNNQPHEPTAEERLQSLEDAMLFLTLGGM